MSTPTRPTSTTPAVPALVPSPRQPADPPVQPEAKRVPEYPTWDGGQPSPLYGQHPWLVAVTGVFLVVALFTAMILLTWAAGGRTPFNR